MHTNQVDTLKECIFGDYNNVGGNFNGFDVVPVPESITRNAASEVFEICKGQVNPSRLVTRAFAVVTTIAVRHCRGKKKQVNENHGVFGSPLPLSDFKRTQ